MDFSGLQPRKRLREGDSASSGIATPSGAVDRFASVPNTGARLAPVVETPERVDGLSLSALGPAVGAAGHGSNNGRLSSSSASLGMSSSRVSAAGGACGVASHGRLEAVLRQTELLRRLDADAHATVTAEMSGQIDKLRSEVASLTKLLNDAHAQLQATASSGSSSSSSAGAGAGAGSATPQQTIAQLKRDVEALKAERDIAKAESSNLSRRIASASDAARESEAARASSAKKYDAEIASLQSQLAASQAAAAAAEARAAHAQSLGGAGAASSYSSSAADKENDPSRELMALRESLRAEQRRVRALMSELETWRSEARDSALAQEKLRAAEARAQRLEAAAAEGAAIKGLLSQACALLGRYEAIAITRSGTGSASVASASDGPTAASLLQQLEQHHAPSNSPQSLSAVAAGAFARSSSLAESLTSRMASVHADAMTSRQRLAEASLKLSTALQAKDAAQAEAAAGRAAVAAAAQAVSEARAEKLRADTRAQLAETSAASLQSLLSTYDAEDKAFGSGASAPSAASSTSSSGVVRTGLGRLSAAAYKARVTANAAATAAAAPPPNPLAPRVSKLEQLLLQSQERNAALLEALERAPLPGQIDGLRAQLASLEADVRSARAESDVLYRHFVPQLGAQSSGSSSSASASGVLCKCGGFSGVHTGIPFTLEEAAAGTNTLEAADASVPRASSRLVNSEKEAAEAPPDAAGSAEAVGRVRILHAVANPTSAALRQHDVALRTSLAAAKAECEALRTAAATCAEELRKLQIASAGAASSGSISGSGSDHGPAGASLGSGALNISAMPTSSSALGSSSLASSGLNPFGASGINTTLTSAAAAAAAADAEKVRQRMKSFFTEGFRKYRSAIAELMGYKVRMNHDIQHSIRQLYHE